jgi:hypothetical protein
MTRASTVPAERGSNRTLPPPDQGGLPGPWYHSRKALLRKLGEMSDEQFEFVAPYLEADLESVDALADLHREIAAGRLSAGQEPVLDAETVYARVRDALSK